MKPYEQAQQAYKERNSEYFSAKKAIAVEEADKDCEKTDKELLDQIHDESLSSPLERAPEITVSRTVARFASLLHNIAKRGDEAAQKNLAAANANLEISKNNLRIAELNIQFQKWLIALTIIILLFTAVGVGYTLLQYYKQPNPPSRDEKANQSSPAQ